MNGYLVLGRCGVDDVPLGLFANLRSAVAFAAAQTVESIVERARDVYRLDVSGARSVSVVQFYAGLPVRSWSVRTFARQGVMT